MPLPEITPFQAAAHIAFLEFLMPLQLLPPRMEMELSLRYRHVILRKLYICIADT